MDFKIKNSFVPDTAITDIEDCLKKFIKRDDIDIILINQNVSILIFRSSCKQYWIQDKMKFVCGNHNSYVIRYLSSYKQNQSHGFAKMLNSEK